MFSFSTIEGYHFNLLNKKFTCIEAVNYYLQKIEQQKHLNAFVEVYQTEALEKAKQLDEQRLQGKALKKLQKLQQISQAL